MSAFGTGCAVVFWPGPARPESFPNFASPVVAVNSGAGPIKVALDGSAVSSGDARHAKFARAAIDALCRAQCLWPNARERAGSKRFAGERAPAADSFLDGSKRAHTRRRITIGQCASLSFSNRDAQRKHRR